jgi:hypothetical protein
MYMPVMRLQTCVSVIVEIIVAEPDEGPTISHGLWVAMYLQKSQVEETDEQAATGQSSNYMAYMHASKLEGGRGRGILLGQSHRVAVFELCAALQLSERGGC